MIRQLLLATLVALPALAQEIGTELPAPTPAEQQTPKPGAASRPQGRKGEPGWSGTRVSAAAMDFGLRAGLSTSTGLVGLVASSSGGNELIPSGAQLAPTGGAFLFVIDGLKLLLELDFSFVSLGAVTVLGLNASLGVEYFFRTPAEALRPLVYGVLNGGLVNLVLAGTPFSVPVFGVQLGGGAEYFFSPSFSVSGRLGVAVPMLSSAGSIAVGVVAVTPGLGASFYF